MANGWRLDLINPVDAITVAINKGWAKALQDLVKWIKKDLIDAMIFGGLGIQGIAETQFYQFISSPDGLSELGINKGRPPLLLKAYKNSFKVSTNNRILLLQFGDTARLKLGTPHPASGTGHLDIASWMEWILDDITVGSGYVPRAKLPKGKGLRKAIRITSAPGGLMLPRGVFGSTGLWRFPANLRDYDRRWLADNIDKIRDAIVNQMTVFLTIRLSS